MSFARNVLKDQQFVIRELLNENSPRVNLYKNTSGYSPVWEKFWRVQLDGNDINAAVCSECYAILSYKSKDGTTGLKRHTCFRNAFPLSASSKKQDNAEKVEPIKLNASLIPKRLDAAFNDTSSNCQEPEDVEKKSVSDDQEASTSTSPDMSGPFLLKKETHCVTILDQLLKDEEYADVTLSAEGQNICAHKVVLSLASEYFKEVLSKEATTKNVIVFNALPFSHLESIINFIYTGEATIAGEELEVFMRTAEMLKISSLSHGPSKNSKMSRKKSGKSLQSNSSGKKSSKSNTSAMFDLTNLNSLIPSMDMKIDQDDSMNSLIPSVDMKIEQDIEIDTSENYGEYDQGETEFDENTDSDEKPEKKVKTYLNDENDTDRKSIKRSLEDAKRESKKGEDVKHEPKKGDVKHESKKREDVKREFKKRKLESISQVNDAQADISDIFNAAKEAEYRMDSLDVPSELCNKSNIPSNSSITNDVSYLSHFTSLWTPEYKDRVIKVLKKGYSEGKLEKDEHNIVRSYNLAGIDGKEMVTKQNGKYMVTQDQALDIITKYHLESNHGGEKKTYSLLSQYYGNISRALVAEYIKRCQRCVERIQRKLAPALDVSHFLSANMQEGESSCGTDMYDEA